MEQKEKKKIVVLGGGIASLTAAHELTDYDGWQEEYETYPFIKSDGGSEAKPLL